MLKKLLFVFSLLSLTILLIDRLIIEPNAVKFIKNQVEEGFDGYIAYKNKQRGLYLYLVDDLNTVKRLKLDTLYEGESFNKPKIDKDVKHIVSTDWPLYTGSHIGHKIKKLAKSNKCFLITGKAIFRFNCYNLSEDDRNEVKNVDEWKASEIGFWKKRSSSSELQTPKTRIFGPNK